MKKIVNIFIFLGNIGLALLCLQGPVSASMIAHQAKDPIAAELSSHNTVQRIPYPYPAVFVKPKLPWSLWLSVHMRNLPNYMIGTAAAIYSVTSFLNWLESPKIAQAREWINTKCPEQCKGVYSFFTLFCARSDKTEEKREEIKFAFDKEFSLETLVSQVLTILLSKASSVIPYKGPVAFGVALYNFNAAWWRLKEAEMLHRSKQTAHIGAFYSPNQ